VASFATLQSGPPAIHELVVNNTTRERLEGLLLTVSAQPAFADTWSTKIDALGPGEGALLFPRIALSTDYLIGLDKAEHAYFEVTVTQGGQTLASEEFPLNLLPYGSWSGLRVFPSSIVGHVAPDHPLIHRFLMTATRLLSALPEKLSLSGYSDPGAVRPQMAALLAALAGEGVTVTPGIPDYSAAQQHIESIDVILRAKEATALELSLFYASCLEGAGLNPLLVFDGGRVLVGCHLEDALLPEALGEDAHFLAGRVTGDNPKILLVNLAGGVQKGNLPLVGAGELFSAPDSLTIIDIRRARLNGVQPMLARRQLPDGHYAPATPPAPLEDQTAPDPTRHWEAQLLDMTTQNPLLDISGGVSLQLICSRPGKLIEYLAGGGAFEVLPAPEGFEASQKDDGGFLPALHGTELEELVIDFCREGRLHSFLEGPQTDARLSRLMRLGTAAAEDRLRPTLYLAAGLLRWYEDESSDTPRLAPLVLIPAQLTRAAGEEVYRLRLSRGKPILNRMLLQLLRTRFGAQIKSPSLSRMEGGLPAFQTIFTAFRQATIERPGWTVKEQLYLGLFDPVPPMLWDDLKARLPAISGSPVAQSLVSGRSLKGIWSEFIQPHELDSRCPPDDFCLPLSADSSQLSAVCAAGEGASFILSGPAGSGKTQTIANMAASVLYRGGRVLILAGRGDSLRGAQDKLDSVGIGHFCLSAWEGQPEDLRPGLTQLLELGRIKSPHEYTQRAQALAGVRADLATHTQLMHGPATCGFSLYQMISLREQNKHAPDGVEIPEGLPELLSPENHEKWAEIIGELVVAAKGCGGVADHPLTAFRNTKFGPSLILGIAGSWRDYRDALTTLEGAVQQVIWILSLPEFKSKTHYIESDKLCEFLLTCPALPARLYACENLAGVGEQLEYICELGAQRDALEAALLQDFAPGILAFDEDSAREQWQQSLQSWALPRAATQKRLLAAIGGFYRRPTSQLQKEQIPELLDKITLYKVRLAEFERRAPAFAELFGPLWNDGKPDFAQLQEVFRHTLELDGLLQGVCGQSRKRTDLALASGFFADAERFRSKHAYALEQYREAWSAIPVLEAELSRQMRGGFTQFTGVESWLSEMRNMTGLWLEHQTRLRDWCAYLAVREKATTAGIVTAALALENGVLEDEDQLLPAFQKALFTVLCTRAVAEDALLQTFSGAGMKEDTQRFERLSEDFRSDAVQRLAHILTARVATAMQNPGLVPQATLLQMELENGGQIPAGDLFAKIPELLPELLPCMLLSLSAAARLVPKTDQPLFDLVILDDAECLQTSEAVGALSLGSSAVVVGDPDAPSPGPGRLDGEPYRREDFVSVLGSCRELGLPELTLDWHYRCRHESLFAFAGSRLYGGGVRTFPSPLPGARVKCIQVDGVYSPNLRQNPGEAKAIVSEILSRLRQPGSVCPSIGVLTLSRSQRELIQRRLDIALQKERGLAAKVRALPEPIIVEYAGDYAGKTRDTVLLSVGYGLSQRGALPTCFGPLEDKDGARLLCLAVARARAELTCYASLDHEDIRPELISSRGVAALRAFLRYCQGQPLPAMPLPAPAHIGAIESAIADFVRSQGFEASQGVGLSGFRVDIGVRRPGHPGRYILGILCDGESYREAATTSDRLLLRDDALSLGGWRLHRVWALDFLQNREKELRRIVAALALAVEFPLEEREPLPLYVSLADFEREEETLPEEAALTLDTPEQTEEIPDAPEQPQADEIAALEGLDEADDQPEGGAPDTTQPPEEPVSAEAAQSLPEEDVDPPAQPELEYTEDSPNPEPKPTSQEEKSPV